MDTAGEHFNYASRYLQQNIVLSVDFLFSKRVVVAKVLFRSITSSEIRQLKCFNSKMNFATLLELHNFFQNMTYHISLSFQISHTQ